MVECVGCESISFIVEYYDLDHEDTVIHQFVQEIFPYSLENDIQLKELNFVPNVIRNIYEETIETYKIKAFILTAAGLHAIIEAICKHL